MSFKSQGNDELVMSRKIYEALNCQLLEELPHLSNKCLKFFDYCLANLINARCTYLQQVTVELQLSLQVSRFCIHVDNLSADFIGSQIFQLCTKVATISGLFRCVHRITAPLEYIVTA